ncbi:MAG: hypothetical protein QM676_05015 [Novosphingobium sp.]
MDQSVAGDADVWMLYERMTADGYPLVVRARTGNSLVEAALNEGHISIVECVADVDLVSDTGMPPQPEQLYDLEDGLSRELAAFNVGALHVATITGDGRRRLVFTHVEPLNLAVALNMFAVSGFSLSVTTEGERQPLIDLVSLTISSGSSMATWESSQISNEAVMMGQIHVKPIFGFMENKQILSVLSLNWFLGGMQ